MTVKVMVELLGGVAASFDLARSSARIFDPHAVALVVVLASILPVGSSQAPVNRPRLTPSGQQARAQPSSNTHINIRAAAILHQSTWPSNLFFAAPSRATPAGSPAWLPRLRSEHNQHRRKRYTEAEMLIASCSAPTCSCPPRATRP
jgi:hypothetical protein